MRPWLVSRLGARALKLRVKRAFARSRRVARARACYIELPRKLWDRIILFLFTGCLFIFLHALLGFGTVDEDLRGLNDTFIHQHAPHSISPPWNWGYEDQKMRPQVVSRVMVDWNGNYELLPMTTPAVVSPASTPQDAFPGPTPALVTAERRRALDQGSLSTTTKVETPAGFPFRFYATPYDPFRLEFEDSLEGGENHGLYPIAGSPRTTPQGVRVRRFGRCLPGEACM